VRRCIDSAARHSGFILSTSCEIPPRSNPEIVKWFMDAAHDLGRYERIL
jgi:uroporphyrinogen-III decarboxylase